MSEKLPLLESKISNLEAVNSNWVKIDSLRSEQTLLYENALDSCNKDISKLEKSLKTSKYITKGSAIITLILALVCVLK